MKTTIFVALAFVMSAPALAHADNSAQIASAHTALSRGFKDPSSAQFRNEWVTSKGEVCGEVNGKNDSGGYVGFRPFEVSPSGSASIFWDDNEIVRDAMAKLWHKRCPTAEQEAADAAAEAKAEALRQQRRAALEAEAKRQGFKSVTEYLGDQEIRARKAAEARMEAQEKAAQGAADRGAAPR